jgi:phospholipid transport system substrate-binding protein
VTPARGALAAALALTVLALAPAPTRAQSPTEDMQQYTDEVARVIRDVGSREQDTLGALQDAMRRLAFQIFGAPEAAREVLGRHWEERTPLEQEDFIKLFAELLEATYLAQIDTLGGGQVKIRYLGELIEGNRADVRARLTGAKSRDVVVDARLVRRGERWLVWDVSIEGVSIIGNYRAQFERIIRRSSYPELVRQVTAKRDDLLKRKRALPE